MRMWLRLDMRKYQLKEAIAQQKLAAELHPGDGNIAPLEGRTGVKLEAADGIYTQSRLHINPSPMPWQSSLLSSAWACL